MRRRIVHAALELFGSEGFEQTTVRAIARRAGVTDGLIFYYYRSKRHILDAIWDIPQARVLHTVDPNRPLTVERLMELVDQMVSASVDMDAMIRLMVRRALAGDTAAARFRQRTMVAWRRDVHAHFATVLSDDQAALNTDLLTSIVFGATFPAMAAAGASYPAVARTPEFQQAIRDLILVALPFCRERTGQ
ncbi:MAG: TetR/AcrR family transcriptional regulator [Tepidiformaceae bacterium]